MTAAKSRTPKDPGRRMYQEAFASVIFRALERRKIPNVALAKALQVSPATASRICRGESAIDAWASFRLCQLLDVRPEALTRAVELECDRLAAIKELDRKYPAI